MGHSFCQRETRHFQQFILQIIFFSYSPSFVQLPSFGLVSTKILTHFYSLKFLKWPMIISYIAPLDRLFNVFEVTCSSFQQNNTTEKLIKASKSNNPYACLRLTSKFQHQATFWNCKFAKFKLMYSLWNTLLVLKRLGLVNFVRPTWSCIRTIKDV